MHVYIDDSGCGGFRFGQGSTSHLVMAACVFRHTEHIRQVDELIQACAEENRLRREFKYSDVADRARDSFFECIKPAQFHVRAIVINKSHIYSEKLRASPAALKSYAIRQLLTKNYGQISGAKVFIDGKDTKAFGIEDAQYLPRMVNRESPGTIAEIRHVDSRGSRPIQLADMVAGSIHRAFRTDRPANNRHLDTFRHRAWQPKGTLWFYK